MRVGALETVVTLVTAETVVKVVTVVKGEKKNIKKNKSSKFVFVKVREVKLKIHDFYLVFSQFSF